MRLLFIDEDQEFIETLKEDFSEKYVVDVSCNSEEAVYMCGLNHYDTLLVSGEPEICKSVREADIDSPIVYVDKNLGYCEAAETLNSGADSYISTPLDTKLLDAQINALNRRKTIRYSSGVSTFGKLKIDLINKRVITGKEIIYLRRKEYDILELLVLNKGKVVTKEQMLEYVWEEGISVLSNTIEVHIRNLRKKLEKPYNQKVIKTIYRFGYTIEN